MPTDTGRFYGLYSTQAQVAAYVALFPREKPALSCAEVAGVEVFKKAQIVISNPLR